MKWFGIRREKCGLPANAYPPLQTERLVMRMFQPGDAMDVFDYARSPIVGAMAGWAPHKTLLESQQVVRRFISRGDVWAIVEKRTGHVIGSIGLHTDSRREIDNARMLGYALGENYWGKGYATEAAREVLRFAFMELQCPILSVYHYPGNTKSRHVIKKLGFVQEGTLRMASALPDGSPTDEVCCSLTREEYLAALAPPTMPGAGIK